MEVNIWMDVAISGDIISVEASQEHADYLSSDWLTGLDWWEICRRINIPSLCEVQVEEARSRREAGRWYYDTLFCDNGAIIEPAATSPHHPPPGGDSCAGSTPHLGHRRRDGRREERKRR